MATITTAAQVNALIDAKVDGSYPVNNDVDSFWLLCNGQFVFLMQIGFMLLEVGCVRAQHAKAICVKNAVDFLVATIFWLILGYPLALGHSGTPTHGGGCNDGTEDCALGHFAGQDYYFGTEVEYRDTSWAMWFFQWSFASATCTIVSGSGAERCSFQGYLISTMCLASFVYPCVVHWGWSGDPWLLDGRTFETCDGCADGVYFFDFAGSGIVHLTGGCVAFVLAAIVGPRDGRFSADGKVNLLQPHNLVLSCSGGLLLVLGWFGFNGGSVLAASGGSSCLAGRVCAITAIGAATGGLSAFGIVFIQSRFINLEALMNGMLAGCVSVTAGASVLHPFGSLMSGVIGGMVYTGASRFLLENKVDDPLDASPIHGACGIWGCAAVGLFANEEDSVLGWFYADTAEKGGKQFAWQLFGCLIIMCWAMGVMSTIFSCMKAYSQSLIRVPLDIELSGDIILYGGSAYPQFSSEAQPPEGDMAIVITDVQGSTSLWEWDTDIMKISISLHEKILRDNTVRFNGFEIMDEGDSLTIAFHNGFDAIKFCLVSQIDLMDAEWPEELFDHPSGAKEDDIYCGLRVRMGCDVGFGNKFLNRVTNRISYNGDVVDTCTALLKAVDDGGIVVTSTRCIAQLQGSFSHRLYEYGDIHMQDVGSYKFDKIEEEMPCIQIMPESICARPATSLSGCTMTATPFYMAPGVNVDEGTAVTLIFMTLSKGDKGAPDPDSKKADGDEDADEECVTVVKECSLDRKGYTTKTSNGVSLLAFHTPDAGYGFIKDVINRASGTEMQFAAGLHTGIPTSVAPNKASGRADYLGPPVNCSARLLSLAAEDATFHKGTNKVAVSSSTWMDLDSNYQKELEVAGQYQLKGIGDKVECLKMV